MFLVVFTFLCQSISAAMTREEAAHVGMPYTTPAIVEKFLSSSFSRHADLEINDFALHHQLVTSFCPTCTWQEYYDLLDHIRLPYKNMFDPGAERGANIRTIQEKYQSGYFQNTCDIISPPTAEQFLHYVQSSQPVIIRSKRSWYNTSHWSNAYLSQTLRHAQVVVSASPTAEYDGPEQYSLWGVPDDPKSTLIVRPAHIQLAFPDFLSLLDTSTPLICI